MERSDLIYSYSWTAIRPDDPRVTGKPDSSMFNRHEGYEVLSLINRYAEENNFKQKASGTKVEKMLHDLLPSDIRSQANIKAWLTRNWKQY